jgi:hypothetical protein
VPDTILRTKERREEETPVSRRNLYILIGLGIVVVLLIAWSLGLFGIGEGPNPAPPAQ